MEDELRALREEVAEQQRAIQELCEELDEERSASTIATNEAMTMILRLQREKAEAQLEARQFKRFAEERMDQDQHEIAELEQEVRSLTDELEEYRRRLEGLGVDDLMESEPEEEEGGSCYGGSVVQAEEGEGSVADARTRRREVEEVLDPDTGPDVCETLEMGEIDKYESPPSTVVVLPPSRAENEHIEQQRIHVEQEEEPPTTTTASIVSDQDDEEEEVTISNSPHLSRTSSADSFVEVNPPSSADRGGELHDISSSVMVVDHDIDVRQHDASSSVMVVDHAVDVRQHDTSSLVMIVDRALDVRQHDTSSSVMVADHALDVRQHDTSSSVMVPDHALDVRPESGAADDDESSESSDRVYTIDAIHGVPLPDPPAPMLNESAPGSMVIRETDLRELLSRLQALEADRDSLKQTLSSMHADPAAAQPVSFWEVAQNVAKAKLQVALQQGKGLLKIQYLFWALSLLPLLKWIVPFLFYRRKKDDRIRVTQSDSGDNSNGGGLLFWLASKLLGLGQSRSLR